MLPIKEIKEILKQERLSISKRRGQNFLVDAGIQRKIINAVGVNSDDLVLEIGPGLGALTDDLAKKAGYLWAVEKDKALAQLLEDRFSQDKKVQIICSDILAVDLKKLTKEKLKVISNLPYYISTPVIAYLLEKQKEIIKDIFITVQYEVGKRLSAKPHTKDYSALSVLVQYFTEPEIMFSIPKRAFYPQPKVDSVFVHLRMLEKPSVKVNSQGQFFKIVRACFQQRRKIILNSLTHNLDKDDKLSVQQMLEEINIADTSRAENLTLADFAKIENAFYQKGVRL